MNTHRNLLRTFRPLACMALTAAILSLGGQKARATEELRKELAEVAKGISQILKSMDETSVSVGSFTGPPTLPTSSGPTFTKMLKEELEKHELQVKLRSKYGVKGEYMDVIDANNGKLAAQIKGELVDTKGTTLLSFNRGVQGATTLSTLFGLTAELPANKSPEIRDQALQQALDKPTVTIKDSKVSASATSPYAIELLIKGGPGYGPRPAVVDDGLAFCKIARNEIYGIRLINNSPHDAAVTLSIDGLSVFAFSENKGYTHFIIPAGTAGDILGWHRNNRKSDAFLVTSYADSAVAQALPSSTSVGTITAVFAAAWTGDKVPGDEPAKAKGSKDADATGRGPEIDRPLVELVRNVGVARAAVSLRYTKPDPTDLPLGEPGK